ncbi:hypothetical protein JCM11491_006961 [Sporobolomyces phaffii]
MLSRHLRTHLVVAPSTSVGKSIFSTGLVRASLALGERVAYLKPVGTGSGDGDDELHVNKFAPRVETKCLFHFDEPVSPHLAVQRATDSRLDVPTDREFARAVRDYARAFANDSARSRSSLYIESAGGVHSPTLNGTSQLDAFRPLLPPTVLIASHALGGISTTVSAYESLVLRGYDVDAVLVFREDYYANHAYLSKWFAERGIPVGVVEPPPPQHADRGTDEANLERYYREIEGPDHLQQVVERLQGVHERRIAELESAPRRTRDHVWWPFVQHGLVKHDRDVMVIDSAHRDTFSVFSSSDDDSASSSLLNPVFDGSASWWTQCLGHANPELTLAAARSAGRFGHVMFPSATNLPALHLAETLVKTVGQGWADRVFFSDNGSTGMEVALKMALRTYCDREGVDDRDERTALKVLGLKGSYHGDTIGAMDACEGGVYSERVEWYQGKGYWLDPPSIRIQRGRVEVTAPGGGGASIATYDSLTDVYDVDLRFEHDPLAERYRTEIEHELADRVGEAQFGALILEPVIMGAGGMIVVDPLYQRVLIDVVRTNRTLFPSVASSSPSSTLAWKGLPVIFDEVFTGLYRLGRESAATFLGSATKPDIACYAKILTGGVVPMSVTLASDCVFASFLGESKVDALLHGHSYTAHAVGCGVANKTLEILDRMDRRSDDWTQSKRDWTPPTTTAESTRETTTTTTTTTTKGVVEPVWSLWSREFVESVSHHGRVDGTIALGTVLVVHLATRPGTTGAGYTSTAAESFLAHLRTSASASGEFSGIHARPLGNVVYFMSSLNSDPATLRAVEHCIVQALEADA